MSKVREEDDALEERKRAVAREDFRLRITAVAAVITPISAVLVVLLR